jgi:hypothetical protein
MVKFKSLLDSNFNQTVENLDKLFDRKVLQKSNRKLDNGNHTSSAANSRNKQILAYFGKLIQIFEKHFSSERTASTPPSITTNLMSNNSIGISSDTNEGNSFKSNNPGSPDLPVNSNPVNTIIDLVKENGEEKNPRRSRNLDIEKEFSIFALFQNRTNLENDLDLDDPNPGYEEDYELDDEESFPKSFGTDIATSFESLFRHWNIPESRDETNSTSEQSETFLNRISTNEPVNHFDETNSTSQPISISNFFRNIPDTLLDESMRSQLQNLTENAGDYLSRFQFHQLFSNSPEKVVWRQRFCCSRALLSEFESYAVYCIYH